MKRALIALMGLAFAGSASAATLTLYSAAPATLAKALARDFSKKTGDHVEVWTSSTVRCPGNSGHYRFKRLTCSRTGRRQPAPSNQAVSGDAGGCKKSRCTPGWPPRPLYGLQRGDDAPFRS